MRKKCEELDRHAVSELESKIKAAAAARVKRKWDEVADEVADSTHEFDRVKKVTQQSEGIPLSPLRTLAPVTSDKLQSRHFLINRRQLQQLLHRMLKP